jgi:hypothetical protein
MGKEAMCSIVVITIQEKTVLNFHPMLSAKGGAEQ